MLQTVLMELHEVGPAKLFDTAGVDEAGLLGEKKRRKVLGVIKVRTRIGGLQSCR
jgi:hypothetical protein